MMKKHTLRGGNTVGYIRNGVLYSDSDSGCLRRILLRDNGIENQTVLSNQTKNVFALGHLSEEFFLADHMAGKSYEVEKAVFDPIYKGVVFEGHSDVVCNDLVYELKSCTSKNTHLKVFRNGEPKTDNAVQLLNYMISLERTKGRLVYTSYTDVMEYKELELYSWEQVAELARQSARETRIFEFEIKDDGSIDIDGKPFNVTINELLAFRNTVGIVLDKQIVYLDRPSQIKESFFFACSGCPYRLVCESYEKTRCPTEEFLTNCKEMLPHE